MSSEARGQFLGFSLQFPRALLRLLEISPGGSVGIEVSGDVSVFFPEGIALSEEDKSSIRGNALTDKSTNLWKTFYNWGKLVQEKAIDVANVRFILYTNHFVSADSFVQWMNDAQTPDSVNPIIEKIHELYKAIPQTHDIYPYLHYLLSECLDTFRELILRFELDVHQNTDELYKKINAAIKTKFVNDTEIEFIRDELSGWLQKEINSKIANRETPIITFDIFHRRFLLLFQKIREKKLVDFAIKKLPSTVCLQSAAQIRPVYVQQLELINSDSSEILEAVSDFFRAKTNRQEWIDREFIDEDAMRDFQDRLQTFHSTQRKHISIINKNFSPEDQGALLLCACKERHETLSEMTPPDRTVSGTYHFLANEKNIGWHPDWESMIEKKEHSTNE